MNDTAAAIEEIAQRDRQVCAWACLTSQNPMQPVPGHMPGPLANVFFGVKDVMDVQGLPTRHGAALSNVQPARFDASCVAMLRAAGAIPIGKTVTAEFAAVAPGPTRNPWRPTHTPGGSSSGSAAAVAAGMVPLALGTQTGGSIIRPAAFNGVVGFKPSFGRVPRTGMRVLCDSLDTIGWFTRDVTLARQVADVFMAMSTEESADSGLTSDAAGRLRVAVLPASDVGTLSGAALEVLKQAADDLASRGCRLQWLDTGELFEKSLAVHAGIMDYELARGLLPVLQGEASALRDQTRALIERGLSIPPKEYARLTNLRRHLQSAWGDLLSDFDLILTPSAPGPAPAGHASTGSSVFNRTWSLLGWPSIHLPISQTDDGLPLGVQCVAFPERDISLLNTVEILHQWMDRRVLKQPQ